MATYGRYSRVCEALACFLAQSYPNRELIILNNHPEPLFCPYGRVTIYNEPKYPTLGHCRQRLLELARGELCRTWDDDDLYLPWAIMQGYSYLTAMHPEADAWKPKRSWFIDTRDPVKWKLVENAMEASITFRTEAVRKVGYRLSGGDEHVPLLEGLKIASDEVGSFASYGYRWGWGEWHISGSLGSDTIESRTRTWKEHNLDVRPGRPLVPADLTAILEKWSTKIDELAVANWRAQCRLPSSPLSSSPATA